MKKNSDKLIMLLMIIVSWAKAGLAGDWILYTINVIVFLVLISNYKTLNYKHIIPFILLIVYFIISYFNPSYKILDIAGHLKPINIVIRDTKPIEVKPSRSFIRY